ncbi:MAG: GNAT family N-acetyltransferase [Anaerolineae bacterium]|jgi:ribosomal protein S18 acetylase RimI-like enzyme|nr:GNAT family N-acetyltransferase [Anaerolineae bacterium]MBT7073241.1 GNAT family N-acetyltransferase [Anaerolineae bacterium]MBT7325343.1 GNAT family N-acetyltransferase [Anaerolineae bacterium]
MQIRLYAPSDFKAVTHLWRRARELAFPEFQRTKGHTFKEDCAYFKNVVLQENNVWVAETDSCAVGFIAIKDDFIDQFYVSPDHQRQGTGAMLLDHARTLSPEKLWLYTFQSNTNGRIFYEKNGFIATKFGVSPAPESEPDVLFEWKR